jgi:hypothetical protein
MQLSFHPRVWLNPFLPAIWPIEIEMFNSGLNDESQELRDKLISHIDSFNYARRYENGREVFFDCYRFGIFHQEEEFPIFVSDKEIKWKSFDLELSSISKLKAEWWIINYHACYIRYSIPTNRSLLKGAAITKMKRFDWDEGTSAKMSPVKTLGLSEDLALLAKEPNLGIGFPCFMLPQEAYEITLAGGDFIAIGEIPDEGMILAHWDGSSRSKGIYLGSYDQDNMEFVAGTLPEAAHKLKLRASARFGRSG